MHEVLIAGVGMIPFVKPGKDIGYAAMGAEATMLALADAGISYAAVQQAIVGYVYGDSTCGQAALYRVGMTGIPIVNVNNNCSTGSSALFLARQLIASGVLDCTLVLGFEQMQPGALRSQWNDRPSPFQPFDALCSQINPFPEIPLALRYFGGAGKDYMDKFGRAPDLFAKVRAKASRHAEHNPMALLRKVVSEEEVLASSMLFPEAGLTRLMACPPASGAAAAILVSDRFAQARDLRARVRIVAQAMTTDLPGTFEARSMVKVVGYDMTAAAAAQVYESAGIGPDDVDVVELHDCFAQNEVLSYEALGLCPPGGAEEFVRNGDNTYGGRVVVNPSGGLLAKGHPLGATGLAQCAELIQQLRGNAGARQEMHTEVHIGRVFVDKCIELVLQNKLGPEDAAMAKYWSSELFGRVLDQCVQLHGGYGYMLEYPIARAWIDNRATRIYGGSTEVMKEIIARSL